MTKNRGINLPKHVWTPEEVALLRARYPHERTADIARELGLRERQVYCQAKKMKLKKSAAFLASNLSGRLIYGHERGGATRFKKGQPSHNKGVRRPGYCVGRMGETQFKKGENPHTWVPVGTERVRMGYVWIKVRDDLRPARKNWISKHQHIWEQAHGPVPAGHIVRFKDNNRTHLALENLECVSRREHVATRGLHALPPDVVKVHILRAAITRQIHKHRPPAPKRRTGRPSKRTAA